MNENGHRTRFERGQVQIGTRQAVAEERHRSVPASR